MGAAGSAAFHEWLSWGAKMAAGAVSRGWARSWEAFQLSDAIKQVCKVQREDGGFI